MTPTTHTIYLRVSVEDRLPKLNEFVTCVDTAGEMIICRRVDNTTPRAIVLQWAWNMRDSTGTNSANNNIPITHWLEEIAVVLVSRTTQNDFVMKYLKGNNMEIKTTFAETTIEINVTCPYCDRYQNKLYSLREHLDVGEMSAETCDAEIQCDNCHKIFIVDSIKY